MRHVGAVLLGIWYALIISSGLFTSLVELSGRSRPETFHDHYVLSSLSWLAALFLSAVLSGLVSRTFPVVTAMLAALQLPASYGFLFLTRGAAALDRELAALAMGWSPNEAGVAFILSLATVALGVGGGFAARAVIRGEGNHPVPLRILGIRWAHYFWLWFPAYFWASTLVPSVYLLWLNLCLGWHWLIHPSLWFSLTWWLFLGLGVGFTYLPFNCLIYGVGHALEALAVQPYGPGD